MSTRPPDYQREGVSLWLGDSAQVLPTLEAGSVDAVVTDPPYGILIPGDYVARIRDDRGGSHGLVRDTYNGYHDTYRNFVDCIVPRINASLDLCDRAAVFTGPHLQEQRKATAIGGIYCPAGCGRHPWGFKTFLPVLFYGKAPNLQNGAKPNTIASTDTAERNGHPCPKPLSWMLWLVQLVSRDSETILDPFMGSGTTAIACIRTSRRFLGIEISETYFRQAVDRIEKELDRHPLLEPPPKRPRQQALLEATP